jgi:predicted ATPase
MPEVSEQRDIDEVIARAASTMEVLARALHVRDAQLQPTLDAIVSAAASALRALGGRSRHDRVKFGVCGALTLGDGGLCG